MTQRHDDWSTTASNNTTVGSGSIDIAENMAPSNVNNAMRDIMASAALSFGGFPEGTSRPSIVAAGSMWLDTTSATAPVVKLFDGTDDITVLTFDYSANTVAAAGSGILNVVEDTTPQLGGNLDLNSNVITGLVIGTNVQAFDATLTSLAALSGVAGDIIYASGTDAWARLAKGTNGEFLKLASGIPAWASILVPETVKATTSGTTSTFTGISASATRITCNFSGISFAVNTRFEIRLGDSGGVEATGYTGSVSEDGNPATHSTGFILHEDSANARVWDGTVVLNRIKDHVWKISGSLSKGSGNVAVVAGTKTIDTALTDVQLTTTDAKTFDAGEWGITVE